MASSLEGLIGDAVLASLSIPIEAGVTCADEGILGVLAGDAIITGGAVRVRAATHLGQRALSQRRQGRRKQQGCDGDQNSHG